ncbi:D-alanyl-D-alanine carboxypeptidase family protein [Candidatus Saccharibacteria bacterium]|nr:D-alanyl-D-alanine carboxypeptidase family protein [Candidatus Saccharibacteria bacterium]
MKGEKKKNKLSLKILFIFIIGLGFVGFLTWFLISFFAVKNETSLVNLYEFPESINISDSFSEEGGIFSVAIDGNIVTGSDEDELRPTASTAKMILGLTIMDKKPFNLGETGEIITISQEFYDKYIYYLYNNGSNTAVNIGEEITEYDALMSVFLTSSNNMADTLAIWAFGSMEEYKNYATNFLRNFGIENTIIGDDASGFSDTTKSTARDLARIGDLVLRNPVLAEIVGTKSHEVPVAGTIYNTNKLLGVNNISGIKTGFIGDSSGYCLISGYNLGEHRIVVALLNAPTREESFNESLLLVRKLQNLIRPVNLVYENQIVGYIDSWWSGKIPVRAKENLDNILYDGAGLESRIEINENTGNLILNVGENEYLVELYVEDYQKEPTFTEKIKHVFSWRKSSEEIKFDKAKNLQNSEDANNESAIDDDFTNAPSDNCTVRYGKLMLINANFMVDNNFLTARRSELVSLSSNYGIPEYNIYNGDNLLDSEAAEHLSSLVEAYEAEHPGHTLGTLSCFRSASPGCGRMCAATGTSDHHTGLTCDLIDSSYGTSLGTDNNYLHPEWQWLHDNSYRYGFIDRFPEEWSGGSMNEPINVDERGSTGFYETWHYRYVGVQAATEIATGIYNNGAYDSLEHYLKARALVSDLKNGNCE